MDADAEAVASEWICAKEALAVLCNQGRNPVEVKAMLAEYLRDGLLRAHAEAVWLSTEPNLGKAWKTDEITEEAERNLVVPVRYWRSDKHALDDRARWRWPYNKFVYTVSTKPLRRRMFKGVRLSTEDLAKLQPKAFIGVAPRTRGRKPDVERRDRGWIAVLKLALGENFNRGFLKDQNDLEGELEGALREANGTVALGRNQISQIARMVLPLVPPAP